MAGCDYDSYISSFSVLISATHGLHVHSDRKCRTNGDHEISNLDIDRFVHTDGGFLFRGRSSGLYVLVRQKTKARFLLP